MWDFFQLPLSLILLGLSNFPNPEHLWECPQHRPGDKSPFFPTTRIIMVWGQPCTSPKPSTRSIFLSRPKCIIQHQRAPHVLPQTFPTSWYSGSSCRSFCPPTILWLPLSYPKLSSSVLLLSTQLNLQQLQCIYLPPQRPFPWFLIYCPILAFSAAEASQHRPWCSGAVCILGFSSSVVSQELWLVHSSSASVPFSAVHDSLSCPSSQGSPSFPA